MVDFMLTIRLKLLANALGAIVSKDLEYFAYSNFLSGLHLEMGYLAIQEKANWEDLIPSLTRHECQWSLQSTTTL